MNNQQPTLFDNEDTTTNTTSTRLRRRLPAPSPMGHPVQAGQEPSQPVSGYKEDITKASRQRREFAEALLERCPYKRGSEWHLRAEHLKLNEAEWITFELFKELPVDFMQRHS